MYTQGAAIHTGTHTECLTVSGALCIDTVLGCLMLDGVGREEGRLFTRPLVPDEQ